MRRSVMFLTVRNILEELDSTGVKDLFDNLVKNIQGTPTEKDGNGLNKDILQVFRDFTVATHNATEDKRAIYKIMNLEVLFNLTFWTDLSIPNSEKMNLNVVFDVYRNLSFIYEQLPKVMKMVEQDYLHSIANNESDIPEALKGKSLLNLIIIENNKEFSSPERVINSIDSISKFYNVSATLENESSNDLIILACDSGSDKSFDFLGLSKVMEHTKGIIFDIWDRVVFYRQNKMTQNLLVIAESLPVLDKINDSMTNGSISPEQAELMKRNIISGVQQFIEVGATIPELENQSSHKPKELLKPEPKLLVSSWNNDNEEKVDKKKTPTDILSNDELELLKTLKKKKKKIKKSKKIKKDKKNDEN